MPDHSLRNRLITAFVGLALIPLLVAGGLLGWHTYSLHLADSYARQQQLAQRVSVQLAGFLERFELRLGDADQLSDFAEASLSQQRQVLGRLLTKQRSFREIWYRDAAGREQIRLSKARLVTGGGAGKKAEMLRALNSGQPLSAPLSYDSATGEPLGGQAHFSPIYYDDTTGEPLMDVSLPIFDPADGKMAGTLGAQVRVKTIWDLIAGLKLGSGEDVYILDAQQRVIAHRNPSVVLRETRFRPFAERERQRGLSGQEAFIATQGVTVGRQSFTVVVERAASVALVPALTGLKMVGAVTVLALAVALSLFYAAIRHIVRPIQEVASAARAIRDGDLNRRVAVIGRDEVGEMAQAFNSMTSRLSATLQELEREVEQRKQREVELYKINKAYLALSRSNLAVSRARDESELFREICRIVVEGCGYRLSWIGLAEQDTGKTVRPVAQAGYEDGYLETLHITWADTDRGRGPTGTSIRERRPVITQDILTNPAFAPWREQALQRGYSASAAFPLISGDQVLGALMVYANEPHAFVDEETRLLSELADNLAYGVTALRAETERKLAVDALRHERDFIQAVVERANSVVVVFDRQGRIVRFNRAAEELTGYACAEVEGTQFWELFLLPEERPDVMAVFNNLKKGNVISRYENHWVMRDKSRRLFDWSNGVLLDESGEVKYIVSVGVDITERKQAEQALRELNANLEARVLQQTEENLLKERLMLQQSRHAAMGEMVSAIAHQWRQPLNALALLLANLNDAFTYGDLDRKAMDESMTTGQRLIQKMSTTIDDFRDFFRIKESTAAFDVGAAIGETVELVRATLANHNIRLKVSCPPGIQAVGSSNELGQVVLNMIMNAKDACVEKSVPDPFVMIDLTSDGQQATITVEDNGGGIPPDVAERVFDPYFTTKDTGTGIGLYMAKIILKQHMGGDIAFTNTPTGTRFVVSFPLVPPPRTDQESSAM